MQCDRLVICCYISMVFPSIKTQLVDVSSKVEGPCRFLYKLELDQPSGSFKLRGMSKLIADSIEKAKAEGQKPHIFSSSGGNAGLASAYASKHHNVPCTVVLPVTSQQISIDKLKSYGANVMIHGAHWGEANSYLKDTVIGEAPKNVHPVYCHPFDNPVLWDGHGEMVDEIAEQLGEHNIDASKVKGIVLSIGGGGLFNGVIEGLKRNKGLNNVPVLAIETYQTPAFGEALKAGRVVTLEKLDTIVNCLAAPSVSETSLENSKIYPTFGKQIDDLEALAGTVDYYDKVGGLVEPACGVTVAASTRRQDLLDVFGELKSDDVIIFIICGGSGVSEDSIAQYRELLATKRQ